MPLAAPGASLRAYGEHLRLLREWLAPLEAWLARFADGPQGQAAPPRIERLPLIAADLADPAMPAPGAPLNVTAQAWAPQAGPAYRWGVSYVIEGSQLGGAMLLRKLAEPLAPHPLHFLRGSLTATIPPGPRWQAFMQALDAQVQSAEDIAQAQAGAADAFDALLALLDANPALAAPPAAPGGQGTEAA